MDLFAELNAYQESCDRLAKLILEQQAFMDDYVERSAILATELQEIIDRWLAGKTTAESDLQKSVSFSESTPSIQEKSDEALSISPTIGQVGLQLSRS